MWRMLSSMWLACPLHGLPRRSHLAPPCCAVLWPATPTSHRCSPFGAPPLSACCAHVRATCGACMPLDCSYLSCHDDDPASFSQIVAADCGTAAACNHRACSEPRLQGTLVDGMARIGWVHLQAASGMQQPAGPLQLAVGAAHRTCARHGVEAWAQVHLQLGRL